METINFIFGLLKVLGAIYLIVLFSYMIYQYFKGEEPGANIKRVLAIAALVLASALVLNCIAAVIYLMI